MIEWVKNFLRPSWIHDKDVEREKIARLEAAEQEVRDLRERGDRAVRTLMDRDGRNHWQEAISRMVQGGVT